IVKSAEREHVHRSFSVDLNSPQLRTPHCTDFAPGVCTERDRSGLAGALHSRRDIHGVAPQAKRILRLTENARDHRADVNCTSHGGTPMLAEWTMSCAKWISVNTAFTLSRNSPAVPMKESPTVLIF